MSSHPYIAFEDREKYKDVCDIRKKADRTNTDVLKAFSGLECPGTELHEWESHRPLYLQKFKKAKQCVQRRITKMKDFSARSNTNKATRKKHIYPIQVAYAYSKDCLKKIGSKKNQDLYEKSVDELIKKMSNTHPDIQSYFGDSIEKSIRGRNDTIKTILDKSYYSKEQREIINKMRNLGYNALSQDDKDNFISLLNEGFTRGTTPSMEEVKEKNEEEEEENNENIRPASKTLKRNIRKRRTAKKSVKSIPSAPLINIKNLDALLQTNKFKITDEHKRAELIRQIEEITKLFKEKDFLVEKFLTIKDIYYSTFEKMNQLDKNMASVLFKLSGAPLSLKSAKRAGVNVSIIPKYDALIERQKLGDNLVTTYDHLQKRIYEINNDIYNRIEKANDDIYEPLKQFYDKDLPKYVLETVNYEIASMPEKQKEKLLKEKDAFYNLVESIYVINDELAAADIALQNNIIKQEQLQKMIDSPKMKDAPPSLLEATKERLSNTKLEGKELAKTALHKYTEKTTKIRDIIKEANRTYVNPFILQTSMKKLIKYESSLKTTMALLANKYANV